MNSLYRQIALVLWAGLFCSAPNPAQTTIHLEAQQPGKTFEGLGAVSAGASSRLLIDYPEPQRSEILDFLFKPHYGASLQHLKVEIGSDVDSTDGSEPSHMRDPNDHNYSRGYEWWLMQEAKKRNPRIALDSLAWGAPGWVGNGTLYTKEMAEYLADFLNGAKKQGVELSYTGTWNEHKQDLDWVKLLRKVLDEHNLSTKIVCCDETPHTNMYSVLDAMQTDTELAKAVAVVGVHYPAEYPGYAPASVENSPIPVWSSEDQPNPGGGPFLARDWAHGGRVLARRYNENYLKAHFTKTEIWSPVTSYYDLLAAPNSGLMYANTPWSGHYDVQSTIWVTAHTTQFVDPGWKYIDSACGYLPNDSGTYVAFHAPLKAGTDADWSVVLETVAANRPQHVTLTIGNGLSTAAVSIWQTNAHHTFEKIATVPVRNRELVYDFEPDSIYTITTTTGQARGTTSPPAPAPFPFPYSDDFESVPRGRTAKFLSDQDGAFEAQPCDRRSGMCLKQQVTRKPIPWFTLPDPFTLAGDVKWTDYTVEVDALIPTDGAATVQGRIDTADLFKDKHVLYPSGYIFRVEASGAWSLLSTQLQHPTVTIAQGKVSLSSNWHHLALQFQANRITALLDGGPVTSVQDASHSAGMVAIGSNWTAVEFDNLKVSK